MRLIQHRIERKNDFHRFCSLRGAFTELFQYSFIVCEVPHTPRKTVATSNVIREGGIEEGREGPHQTSFDDANLTNKPY